ncbi:MAG: hypothetical protein ABW122_05485 [Ilumatobacteraceae bacterium]
MSDPASGTALTGRAVRTPRAAAVAGIVFSVLLTATFVLVRWAVPTDAAAAGTWMEEGGRRDAFVLALNLLPFAGIAFLWFIGVLRDRIGAHEDRFFATVFLGSGLLFVAMLFTCGAIAGGLVLSFGDVSGPPPAELWTFGRRVTLSLLTVYALRMAAVFAISTTTIAARLGLVPRWLVVFGAATGVVLLVTVGRVPWVEIIFPMWVFVLSVHILIATFRSSPDPGPVTFGG